MRADAAANRARVLDAAALVFGEHGVDASTEEVARRAGVGIGTVFRHFPTKRDLVEATLAAHFEELDAWAASDATAPTLAVVLTHLIETGSTKLALAGYLLDRGDLGERVTAASDALRATIGRVLRRDQAAGSVRDDVTVDEVYFLVRGLAQARSTAAATPAVRRRALEVVVDGLRPTTALRRGPVAGA